MEITAHIQVTTQITFTGLELHYLEDALERERPKNGTVQDTPLEATVTAFLQAARDSDSIHQRAAVALSDAGLDETIPL